ncbi:hypothetical protein JZ751_016428 [Albula glossodonta]|uniref:Uncharacterized protein n=1 Tax=Albula glossodonta TaxID=121402 RepID=A0A8T2NS81_9TELE|nr:hypothetical protein JZ751_016428 [Albula glossodonta]
MVEGYPGFAAEEFGGPVFVTGGAVDRQSSEKAMGNGSLVNYFQKMKKRGHKREGGGCLPFKLNHSGHIEKGSKKDGADRVAAQRAGFKTALLSSPDRRG